MVSSVKLVQSEDLAGLERALDVEPKLAGQVDEDGVSALGWAAVLGNESAVRLLLKHGASPNASDNDGETALHVACFNGDHDIVSALIASGADVNAATSEGKTPLMNSSQSGCMECISQLLLAGANAEVGDEEGRSCLHWACVGDHDDPAVVERLLKAGAHVSGETLQGATILDYARLLERREILLAIEKGSGGK